MRFEPGKAVKALEKRSQGPESRSQEVGVIGQTVAAIYLERCFGLVSLRSKGALE